MMAGSVDSFSFRIHPFKDLIDFESIPETIIEPEKSNRTLYVALVVIGIFSLFVYKKVNLAVAAASFVVLSGSIIYITASKPRSLNDDRIPELFNEIIRILRKEGLNKREAFLHVFKEIPRNATEHAISDAVHNYGLFYDTGEYLDEFKKSTEGWKLPEISEEPTPSMQNYRELSELANQFLDKNIYGRLNKILPKQNSDLLIKLRDGCCLLLKGQYYRDDQKYDRCYMRLDKTSWTLRHWD
jgi:hypothetical protein